MSAPSYYWKIESDYVGTDAEGVEGPSGCDTSMRTNPGCFAMYDDDHEFYYEGMIYGDYNGFEPLDDFGRPNAGATQIMINGVML